MSEIDPEAWSSLDPYRKAHEMADRHGRAAAGYAARLEIDAHDRGQSDEGEFWKKVRAALAIRSGR